MHKLIKKYEQMTFRTKVTVLLCAFIAVIFIALYAYIHAITSKNIEDEVGKKALAVAETLANSPTIIQAFDTEDPSIMIQTYTESVQKKIDAEFIVVGDIHEIRLAHPIPDRIGKKMVGDDNKRALQYGESYISKEIGSIGFSIRGKSPIYKEDEIIGVVSVGYLLDDIPQLVWAKNRSILVLFIIFLAIGVIGSFSIAHYLKQLLHNMEPEQIASLLLQKEVILQSTKEGIIAVDTNEIITMINESAIEIFQIHGNVVGEPFSSISSFPLLKHASAHDDTRDMEYILNQEPVILNVSSLMRNNSVYGAVVTFRKKTDLEKVTQELHSIRQYSEGLRAQTHEYSNKIHTLYGLLQLHHVEEAKQFIIDEVETSSTYYPSLEKQIEDPVIQGLLIAKYNIANEKGISFEIEKHSTLKKISYDSLRQSILLSIGNLIDNAFTATKSQPYRFVQLHLTDVGQNIVVEVDDNGEGIPEENIQQLFDDGYSTKKETGHGKGLFLVQQAVRVLGGEVFIDESDFGGTRFVVIIPKKGNI